MFFSKSKSILGIDIGTSNIKIVQIGYDSVPVLETYGLVNIAYQLSGKNDGVVIEKMAAALRNLINRAHANAHRAVISFPNNAVFTSLIELPKMNTKDLGSSVEFEAKKYVPLSLSEVDLSWTEVGASAPNSAVVKILLTAVPKQITKSYMEMFSLAGIQPEIGEIEALALIRSLIGQGNLNCVIIDIGARVTGLNIVENGMLRMSRSLNIGGDTVTAKIAQTLNISLQRAEQFKKDFGISSSTFIPETIKPIINQIKSEVKQLITIYKSHQGRLDKIILAGGGGNLPGIIEFFSDLGVPVELGQPLATLSYKKELEPILKRYALSLAVAIGLGLRRD